MGAMEDAVGVIAKELERLGVEKVSSAIARAGGRQVTISMHVRPDPRVPRDPFALPYDVFDDTGLPVEVFCRLVDQIREARK